MSEPYTLTERDIEGCRTILAQLEAAEAQTGAHSLGPVQAHTGSATATIRFERQPGPLATAEAISLIISSGQALALICRKVIAHYETHGGGS